MHLFRDLKRHEKVMSSSVRKCSLLRADVSCQKKLSQGGGRSGRWGDKAVVGFHNDLTPGKQGEQGRGGEEVCRELSFELSPAVQLPGEMQRAPDHHPDFQQVVQQRGCLQQLVFHKFVFLIVDQNTEMAQLRL